jgi:hypothetical protein
LNSKVKVHQDHVFINDILLGRIIYKNKKYSIRYKNTVNMEGIQFGFMNHIGLEDFISDLCDECDDYFYVLEKILFELQ